jgi:two-component system OmpR family sensor kinase/two-component system sensor histidine kinase BaeS
MLAFLIVILVAVATVAFLSGWATETEFRRYAFTYGGTWDRKAAELTAYYSAHDSWEGVQDTLQPLQGMGQGGRGRGSGGPGSDFQLADPEGRIVADTDGSPGGTVSRAEVEAGIPIEVEGRIVGYLLPSVPVSAAMSLDPPQAQFLTRVRTILWIAALVAMAVALIVGGVLFRSIIAPLRRLTAASQAIAEGDLAARAPVRGRDEIARLAEVFNRMGDSLTRAEDARRNQTADVAHELRTPLTVLQGALEAMLDGVYPADQKNLQAALAQVRTLTRLVEDLRLLALADAGQLRLRIAPLDLGTFLQEIVDAHRIQARERKVHLALEMSPVVREGEQVAPLEKGSAFGRELIAFPLVLADRERLAQVIGNLVGNALRHVPPGGHISVRVAWRDQEAVVAVVDDGPGVAAEDLPRLFDRFWRGDPTRRRATGGSGLGLAIVRHIVEAHSGGIWAEPTPGGGLTVSFTVPIAASGRGEHTGSF